MLTKNIGIFHHPFECLENDIALKYWKSVTLRLLKDLEINGPLRLSGLVRIPNIGVSGSLCIFSPRLACPPPPSLGGYIQWLLPVLRKFYCHAVT